MTGSEDICDRPADWFGDVHGSEGDVHVGVKLKAVYTPELLDVEGAVGLLNGKSVSGRERSGETGGRARGGCHDHRSVGEGVVGGCGRVLHGWHSRGSLRGN